jgi:hypothetical protein
LSLGIPLVSEPRKIFDTEDAITDYLSSFPEGKPIGVTAIDHAMVIYKKGGKYCFYDSNDEQGETVFDDPAMLTRYLYLAASRLKENEDNEPITFLFFPYIPFQEARERGLSIIEKAHHFLEAAEADPLDIVKLNKVSEAMRSLKSLSVCVMDEYEAFVFRIFSSKRFDIDSKDWLSNEYMRIIKRSNDKEALDRALSRMAEAGMTKTLERYGYQHIEPGVSTEPAPSVLESLEKETKGPRKQKR